jgi:hypothetical protein
VGGSHGRAAAAGARERPAGAQLPADIALETPAAEPVSRDGGNGAGALPFQLSETREHPEARLTPYEPPQPTPEEEAIPEYEALREKLGRAGVQQDNARLLKGLEAAGERYEAQPGPPPPGPGVLSNVTGRRRAGPAASRP